MTKLEESVNKAVVKAVEKVIHSKLFYMEGETQKARKSIYVMATMKTGIRMIEQTATGQTEEVGGKSGKAISSKSPDLARRSPAIMVSHTAGRDYKTTWRDMKNEETLKRTLAGQFRSVRQSRDGHIILELPNSLDANTKAIALSRLIKEKMGEKVGAVSPLVSL